MWARAPQKAADAWQRPRRFLAALALAVLLPGFGSCDDMGTYLRAYGYSELMPPSTLLAPGAMVSIESRCPLRVRLLCGPRASLGPNWQPRESHTAGKTFKKQAGKSFEVGGEMLHTVKADARFKSVKSIRAQISSPKLIELDDNDVISGLKHRSPECSAAVALRLRAGYLVTMISSGLQADVTYQVEFDREAKIEAKDKVGILKGLALEISAGTSSVNSEEISAKGLMWGVRDDEYLAALTMEDINENCIKRGTRLIDPAELASYDIHPAAPVVPPPADSRGRVGPSAPVLKNGEEVLNAPASVESRHSAF